MERIQIHMFAKKRCIVRNGALQIGMLDRLDEAQVPFGQLQVPAPWKNAQHRDADTIHAEPRQAFVPGTRDPVQDDACKGQFRIISLEPERSCGRRLRLTADVNNQQHGPARPPSGLGTGTESGSAPPCNAVKQAHRAFGDDDVRA